MIPSNWENCEIKNIARIFGRIGFRGYTKEDIVGDFEGAISLSPSNLKDGKIDVINSTFISWYKYEESPEIKLQNGDVVLVKTGSTYGKSAYINNLTWAATLNPQIIVFKNIRINNKLFAYFIQTPEFQKQIEATIVGGAIPTLSQKQVYQFEIVFPIEADEQEKIAEALSDTDDLILSLEKLIEKKKAIKQGAMQNLLTSKIRLPGFTGEWEELKVKDIFTVTRGYVLPVDKTTMISDEEYKYPVYSSQTKNDGLMGYYNKFLYEDAITWTTDGANAGTVHYRKGKFYCTNVCGVLLNTAGIANKCIASMINSVSKSYVSYVGNPKLMNNVMGNIILKIPCLKEQKAIAEILSDMDKEIEQLGQKLAKARLIKQGMMQQLLTGKIRLV